MSRPSNHRSILRMLKKLDKAIGYKRFRKAERILEGLGDSADLPRSLDSVSLEEWQSAVVAGQRSRTTILVVVIVIFLLGSFVSLAGLLYYWTTKPDKKTESMVFYQQVMIGTYTLTPTTTPTLTPTPSPTSTPTPSATPTATHTPTPFARSRFEMDTESQNQLYPAPAGDAERVWLIDVDNEDDGIWGRYVVASPAEGAELDWLSTGSGDSLEAVELYEKTLYITTGGFSLTWTLDEPFQLPFDRRHLMEVFVLDTVTQGNGDFTFNVVLSGGPVQPLYGANAIRLERNQRFDEWRSLGIYEVGYGDLLQVIVDVPEMAVGSSLVVDRLMVVELSAQTEQLLRSIPVNINDRPVVQVMDDSQVVLSLGALASFTSAQLTPAGWQQFEEGGAYNGSMLAHTGPRVANHQIRWYGSAGSMPPGIYQLFVYVPANNATAQVSYYLLADEKIVPRDAPASMNQQLYSNQWVDMGVWQVTESGELSVALYVEVLEGIVGIDAVAIVRVGDLP